MIAGTRKKFGTIKGVFIPSTEAILGTVLFLLLPTLTGDAGLFFMGAIALLAHSVSFSTAFSLSDVATNLNKIGGGGMYALSKKSLGKALGGSIGVQLYFAQAASISFYCIGFAEPLQPVLSPYLEHILPAYSTLLIPAVQKQLLATASFLIFFTIVMAGADFTLKIQSIIFVILSISITAIFISPLLRLELNNAAIFTSQINLLGNRAITLPIFFLLFTQFFPAVTGIDAGVGMSGDLKNPQRSLVRGTFASIGFTFAIYMTIIFVFSFIKKEFLVTGYSDNSPVGILLTKLLGFNHGFPYNIPGILVFAGILFATSSSALSVFMTAPRTLQSLAKDRILPPKLYFLEKDFKKEGSEPRFASLPTFIIALTIIWSGNINFAATVVGICFLVVYGWINGAAFLERLSKNPTFRPTSKSHWSISLYGFLACSLAILLFDPLIGIVIYIVQYIIFLLIFKYKSHGKLEGVWWGVIFTMLNLGLKAMTKVIQGSKNFRPIVSAISFAGSNHQTAHLAFLGKIIADHKGLVHLNVYAANEKEAAEVDKSKFELSTGIVITKNPTEAIFNLMQTSHPAGIRPNTVLLEFSSKIDGAYLVNQMLAKRLHILILKNAGKFKTLDKIDIWWGSERNGNLMLLLAYIMKTSKLPYDETGNEKSQLRIIHMPENRDSVNKAMQNIEQMLVKARLSGEVTIIEATDEPKYTLIKKYSSECDLVLIGLPGKYIEHDDPGILTFLLDELFFERDLKKYDDLPPILFVRSAFKVNLIEE